MKTVRTTALSLFILLFFYKNSLSQTAKDSLPDMPLPEQAVQLAEELVQQAGSDESLDFSNFFEELESYRRKPLSLNKAGEDELRDLRMLSDVQILNFLRYRQLAGDLISIYELQAVPGFDLATIRRILPYVGIENGANPGKASMRQMLMKGRDELYLRWSRILERQKGYEGSANAGSPYLGDPNQLYIRFRHQFGQILSWGFAAEKDRGEQFFTGYNRQGFDFYSAFFHLREVKPWLRDCVLGDFSINMGQGLILFTGFAAGKGSLVTGIKRNGRALRPYHSVNEDNFLRGLAFTIAPAKRLECTLFASSRSRDANIRYADTLGADPDALVFSSMLGSGLHRTFSELNDRDAIRQFSAGAIIAYKRQRWRIAINTLYDRFNLPWNRTPQPYNYFFFEGSSLLNTGVDYSAIWGNWSLFGEWALSSNGSWAFLQGLLLGLDRNVDLALLLRHYPPNYQALNASAFAETAGARNETGIYLGLEIRPRAGWTIATYADIWQNPWLRFQVDSPGRGSEYRLRITHHKKRVYESYVECRTENKPGNVERFDYPLSLVEPTQTFLFRAHLSYHLNKYLEWRSRLDISYSDNTINSLRRGVAFYQDILYKPIGFPLSFTTRFAVFDTDGYQARLYSYENDLLNSFSIPPYYQQGVRFYINLRYRPSKFLTIEGRFAQTWWANQPYIGSDLEQVSGPARSQISAQMRWVLGG